MEINLKYYDSNDSDDCNVYKMSTPPLQKGFLRKTPHPLPLDFVNFFHFLGL